MALRQIMTTQITSKIRRLCIAANTVLGDDVVEALKKGYEKEESPGGKDIFLQLLENARIPR